MLPRIPRKITWPQIRRPFQLEIRRKGDFDIQGPLGLHVERDDRARLVHRNKKRLTNLKRGVAIYECARLRASDQGSREWLRRQNAAVNMKTNMQAAQNFEWVNPSLKLSFFVSQQRGAPAGRRNELARAHGTRYLRQARCVLRPRRQGPQKDPDNHEPTRDAAKCF